MSELVEKSSPSSAGFLASVGTVLSGQGANIILGLFAEMCFARLLGPAARGQISLCLMTIGFGVLVGGLGADIPIVIWSADRTRRASEWISTLLICALLGSIVAAAFWWLIYWVWHPIALKGITPSLFRIVLVTLPFAVLFSYLNSLLTGRERFRERVVVGIAENSVGLASFLGVTWLLGRIADSAIWGYLIGVVVGIGFAIFFSRSDLRGMWKVPDWNQFIASGLFTGLRGQIGNVAAFFNYRFDVFLVNYFLNPEQVGFYALGVVISEGLWQIPQATALALFPRTARTAREDASKFGCLILRHVFAISCFSAGALALASPVAVPLLFGQRFLPSVRVIWLILPGTIAISMGKVAASQLTARRKTGITSILGGFALAITLVLDLLLIPRIGIQGAAIASSVSYLFNGGMLLARLRTELHTTWGALLIPSREELLRYKSLWLSVVSRSRMRIASLY